MSKSHTHHRLPEHLRNCRDIVMVGIIIAAVALIIRAVIVMLSHESREIPSWYPPSIVVLAFVFLANILFWDILCRRK